MVHDFAEAAFDNIVEINFDLQPEKADLFVSRDPRQIINILEVDLGVQIILGKTLLFLDEIQCAPELIALLRYFYEKEGDLHIVAAGSLLDFTLNSHDFSMPVGRIEYMFIGPMDFYEFLVATEHERLVEFLQKYELGKVLPGSLHHKLISLMKIYCAVGGMPAAVKQYIEKNIRNCAIEQRTILLTYEDDFSKYTRLVNTNRLKKVFGNIPGICGDKVKYVNINREEQAKFIAESIDMLHQARVIYKIHHTSASGFPLSSQRNSKVFKLLFLDVGLLCSALGYKASDIEVAVDIVSVNSGKIAEQFIGQQLLFMDESYLEPELHYWNREKKNSSAEIDFVIN